MLNLMEIYLYIRANAFYIWLQNDDIRSHLNLLCSLLFLCFYIVSTFLFFYFLSLVRESWFIGYLVLVYL